MQHERISTVLYKAHMANVLQNQPSIHIHLEHPYSRFWPLSFNFVTKPDGHLALMHYRVTNFVWLSFNAEQVDSTAVG